MGGERTYVTPGFIAAMVVLGASGVVIILVAAIFVSWCIWKYFRHLREPSAGIVQMRNRIRESEVNRAMENGGVGRGIHRVVSVGVPPGFILTLPLVSYSKNGAHLVSIDAKGHMSECPVCLNEYRDGERVRLLPNCKHIFHPKCINTWLESHATCPLCRTSVQLLRKGKSVSSVDRILSLIRRSGSGRGAHVVDSSGRDRYSTSLQPVTVVTPPPQLSTGGQLSPFTREPFSRPVSREIHMAHMGPESRELPRGQPSDASTPPSSSAREAGMIFSSVWGPYVDSQTSGTSCSSSSGVGSSQVLVASMPSSEDASTSATGFVTISLDPEQPER